MILIVRPKIWLLRDGALLRHDICIHGVKITALPIKISKRVFLMPHRNLLDHLLLVVRVPFAQKGGAIDVDLLNALLITLLVFFFLIQGLRSHELVWLLKLVEVLSAVVRGA